MFFVNYADNEGMMKNFLRVIIISLCLVVSQAPTTSLAQSNGETEIHDSSVDLVFGTKY